MRRPKTIHGSPFLVFIAVVLLLAASCVEIGRQPVEVTPGVVPEELQGARWDELPVSYCFVESDLSFVPFDRFVELTNEAFSRWGVEATSDGMCDEAAERNGRNEITWGDTPDLATGPVYEAGYTRLVYSRCTLNCPADSRTTITEADILIDPEPPERARNEDCLFSTLLHEAGHFFGVHHLESPAVMAPVSSDCPQELTDADRAALRDLYGNDVAAARP